MPCPQLINYLKAYSSDFAISKTQAYVHEYGFHFKDFIVQLMFF